MAIAQHPGAEQRGIAGVVHGVGPLFLAALAMAEVEQNPTPLAQHDLRRIAVAHWVKNDLMLLWHVDPS